MENVRLALFLALGVVLMLLWNAWQADYGQHQQPAAQKAEAPATSTGQNGAEPSAPGAAAGGSGQQATASQGGGETAHGAPKTAEAGIPKGQQIHVTTDLLNITISSRGAEIVHAGLRKHHLSSTDPQPFPLLHTDHGLFVAESGLQAKDRSAPDNRAAFSAPQTDYRLAEGKDKLVVDLTWQSSDGVRVVKRYVFHRNSYVVDLEQRVVNDSASAWKGYQYTQLRRTRPKDSGGLIGVKNRSYTGGVIYTPADKYEKVTFDDMDEKPLDREVTDGWVAILQHYFLAAWIPPRDLAQRFYTRAAGNGQYIIGMSSPWQTVQPGQSHAFKERLFVGPKEQDRLEGVAPGLQLTVDYGMLTFISGPLFWLLSKIHSVVGNWGWAIVILVIGLKGVFYPLSETSYRSMAKMRKLQPKMQQLKERHGDDRQKMNQELMQLYQKEKVNPLAGCLPIAIQIPVFIALYWVLLESAELRGAPFILWINDLSVRDPYFVLPIAMAVLMFLQQRISPAPMDPIQKKVMMALPLVFGFFFLWFPAGLVLYWVVNNSLSILQQWMINRRMERSSAK